MEDLRLVEVKYPIGQIATILLALGVTFVAAHSGWTWALSDWDGWPLLSRLIPIAAWANVLAWSARRWGLVIICSMLTFGAPWGFIYPGILAGPLLAVAGGVHWARGRYRSEPSWP